MAAEKKVTVTFNALNKVNLTFELYAERRLVNNDSIEYTPIVKIKKDSDTLSQAVYFDASVNPNSDSDITIYEKTTYGRKIKDKYFKSGELKNGVWYTWYKFTPSTWSNKETKSRTVSFWINFKDIVYSQASTDNVSLSIKIEHNQSSFHHIFYGPSDEELFNDWVSDSFTAPSYSVSKNPDNYQYKLSWIKAIDSKIRNSDNSRWITTGQATTSNSTQGSIVYTYSGFGFKSGSYSVACGGTVQGAALTGDKSWEASYDETTSRTDSTVGTVESSAELEGYTFKGWYTGTDFLNTVTSTRKVTSDSTYYAKMVNNEYYVAFDISSGDPGQTVPNKVIKTYARECTLPPHNITKNGYKQVGWVCEDFKDKECRSGVIPYNIDFSTGAEKASNSETIIMVPIWEAVERKINYNYYIKEQSTVQTDVTKFIIEDYKGTTEKNDPSQPYSRETDNNFIFLGWAAEKPTGWDECKGLYFNVDNIDKTLFYPDSYKFKYEDVWVESDTIERYGVWTCTGKYIYLNNNWYKISVAYIKTDDGWRACENFYVNTPNGWKHEKDNES